MPESGNPPWILFMDLDGTMWDNLDISTVSPPYESVGPGQLQNWEGKRVTVFNDALEFVRWARSKGAITSTLSWNIRKNATEALDKLGIASLFDYDGIEFTPEKDRRILAVLERLREKGIQIPPERIVYIDDRDIHLNDILKNVGNIVFIKIWSEAGDYSVARNIVCRSLDLS